MTLLRWLRRLVCRHRTLIRTRVGPEYLAVCDRCGYTEPWPTMSRAWRPR